MRFSRGENIFSLTLNAKTRNTTKRLSPLTTPAAATQTKWRPGAPERHHGRAQEAVGRAGSPVTWVPPPLPAAPRCRLGAPRRWRQEGRWRPFCVCLARLRGEAGVGVAARERRARLSPFCVGRRCLRYGP